MLGAADRLGVLLASTFFPAHAGTVVFAMYLVSILVVVLVGLGLRATLWRAVGADPLVIDFRRTSGRRCGSASR